MALPTRGQHDWDDDLNNYITGLEARLQAAEGNANSAQSNANEARNTAQSVKDSVIGAPDGAVKNLINDTTSQTRGALNASFASVVRSDTGAPLATGHVKITVDPTTHEIVDITWEA